MTANEFFNAYGRHEVRRVAILAGTSYDYLYQVAFGYRRPGADMAVRLESASGGRMGRVELMWPHWQGNGQDGVSAPHDS